MKTNHRTMTYREIGEALVALNALASKGYGDQKQALKVARTCRWAKHHFDECEEARLILVEGHAERDADGNKVPVEQLNPETGQMEPVENMVRLKDPVQFQEEVGKLYDTAVNTSGVMFTEEDLRECKLPSVYVGLGPLFDWGDDGDGASKPKPEVTEE